MGGGGGDAKKVIMSALIANGIIAIAKFAGFFVTRSSAMLAEAFHSVADTGNQLLMMLGLNRSAKPPDRTHPYGYGKEAYFWSFVVSISIFTMGATFAFYEGIHKLVEIYRHGAPSASYPWVAISILSVGTGVEGWSLLIAIKEYRVQMGDMGFREAIDHNRSSTIVTILFEDAAAVAGLLVALAGVVAAMVTGNPLYDALATVLIGVILAVVAFFLGYMTKNLLIGLSANDRDEAAISEAILGITDVQSIVELKTLHMGEQYILLNVGIAFRPGLTTLDLERAIDAIEEAVNVAVPSVQRIFIEADSLRTTGGELPPEPA